MVQAIKERAVIKPGGILQIQRSDLPEGARVEVIVMIEEPAAERENSRKPLTSFWGAAKGTWGTQDEADAYLEEERNSWD
jgi:hypothetical protein